MRRRVLGSALRAAAGGWLLPLLGAAEAGATARGAGVPGIDESTLSRLTGYRVTLTFRYQGADSSGQAHAGEIVVTRLIDNRSGDYALTLVETDTQTRLRTTTGYYHAGGYSYALQDPKPTSLDSPCVPILSEQKWAQFKQMFNPRIFVASASKTTLERRGETVSGIAADRYSVQQVNSSSFTSSSGSIWVAQSGGFVVAYSGRATGSMQILLAPMTGNFTWSYVVDLINQPPAITLPQSCAAQQIDGDIPVPSGAQLQLNESGSYGFRSASTPATVADFYRRALPDRGWRIVPPSGAAGGGWLFVITKDRRQYQIAVTSDGATGSLIVITPVAGAAAQGGQVPIPGNATDVNRSGTTTFFNTPSSVDQIAQFYRKAMADRGWTSVRNQYNLGTLELAYAKGTASVLIRIAARKSGGTAVMVAE